MHVSAFRYRHGSLIGIKSVNSAGGHMFGRRLLDHRQIWLLRRPHASIKTCADLIVT